MLIVAPDVMGGDKFTSVPRRVIIYNEDIYVFLTKDEVHNLLKLRS